MSCTMRWLASIVLVASLAGSCLVAPPAEARHRFRSPYCRAYAYGSPWYYGPYAPRAAYASYGYYAPFSYGPYYRGYPGAYRVYPYASRPTFGIRLGRVFFGF
jgi:hypothetical protein